MLVLDFMLIRHHHRVFVCVCVCVFFDKFAFLGIRILNVSFMIKVCYFLLSAELASISWTSSAKIQ